ncbi:ComEC/Rec2 family competence protein [Acetobacter sp. DsW_063]|uniref:ComEC/Rec2 family competence protein n=1 Tax=Acetobacter sp. DsW_063 TaxID=1514894 RepID=UPI000B71D6BE|nr:ComEC/Rec2 family competence protein [Acetobacter sp. DsW_063]OUJ14652.1 competence protein ComEC [Acetobacter sp. DsW_063]
MSRLFLFLLSERHRLPLWLPVGMAIGVLLYLGPREEPTPWAALVAAAMGVALLAAGWRRLEARLPGAAALSISIGFLAAWSSAHRQPPVPELPRRAVYVTGRVDAVDTLAPRSGDSADPSLRRVTLGRALFETPQDEGMLPLRRSLRIRLRGDDVAVLAPGDQIRVRALLRPPPFPALPGMRDQQREAWFSGLAGGGRALGPVEKGVAEDTGFSDDPSVESRAAHTVTAGGGAMDRKTTDAAIGRLSLSGEGVSAASSLETVREIIAARIRAVLPDARGAIAATVLVGLSSAIPAADRGAFAASGLAHLLAVAGLHLGIVIGLIMAAVRTGLALWEWAALRLPCKEIAAVAGLLGGAIYVALTGMHLPALRSLVMAGLVVLALLTGRRAASMRGLATAAAVLLLTGPAELLNAPFQMSIAAVMALIAGYETLRKPLLRLYGDGGLGRRLLVHVVMLGLTSLLAGLTTLPVSVAHFGEIQPFFVLANLIAVPLTALWVMPAGLIAVVIMPLHLEAAPLHFMGEGLSVILWFARMVAAWPAARIATPLTPAWGLAAFLLGLCWLCLWSRRWRLLGLAPMLVGCLSPFLVVPPDIVVAADGGVIGVRDGGRLYVAGRSRDAWVEREAWKQAFALPLGDLPQAGGQTQDGAATCGEDGASGVCVFTRGGRSVLLRVEDNSDGAVTLPASLCVGMDLFVTVSPARASCPGVRAIDRFTVWREGAQAVWLEGAHMRVLSDSAWTGRRLWTMRPGGHGTPNLPMAEEE